MLTKAIWIFNIFVIISMLVYGYKQNTKVEKLQQVLFVCINEGSFLFFNPDDPTEFEVLLCKRG